MENSPRMITLVVPSPHSSSCVRLSSIMFFAAGCATSISRKIALPSFVNLANCQAQEHDKKYDQTYRIPPMGSRIIFSIALGPKHVLITSATVCRVVLARFFFQERYGTDFGSCDVRYLGFSTRLPLWRRVWDKIVSDDSLDRLSRPTHHENGGLTSRHVGICWIYYLLDESRDRASHILQCLALPSACRCRHRKRTSEFKYASKVILSTWNDVTRRTLTVVQYEGSITHWKYQAIYEVTQI